MVLVWNDLDKSDAVGHKTHSLTAALDQLRVVASSTSNDKKGHKKWRKLIRGRQTGLVVMKVA